MRLRVARSRFKRVKMEDRENVAPPTFEPRVNQTRRWFSWMSRSYPELASPLPSIYNGKLKESVFWTEREEGRVLPFKWLEMRAGAVETEESSNALVCFRALFNFLSPKLYCGTVVVLSCLRGKLMSLHVDYTLCVVEIRAFFIMLASSSFCDALQ